MAKVVHMGPYEECGLVYEQLFSWISEKWKNCRLFREAYLNNPLEVSPEEKLAEIYALLY